MKHFENISAQDLQTLENAVSQIAVLIASADGKIDKEETDWMEKLLYIRTYSGNKALHDFYADVEVNFHAKFDELAKLVDHNLEEAQAALSASISDVNPILAKLDHLTAYRIYHSYITLASSVAKASGGILGFGAVSYEEGKLTGLSMITPISKPVHLSKEEEKEEKEEKEESK